MESGCCRFTGTVSAEGAYRVCATGEGWLHLKHVSGQVNSNDRGTYWLLPFSDRSLDAIATRMGENANPCTPLNPVAMGVTTPVLRSTRPTLFTTFAAV